MSFSVHGLKARLLVQGDTLIGAISESLANQSLTLEDGDLIVLSSKVVSLLEGGLRHFDTKPIEEDKKDTYIQFLAEKSGISYNFAEIVVQEADEIIGWIPGGMVTIKDEIIQCNAGIDCSNAGQGNYIKLPKNSDLSAFHLYHDIKRKYSCRVGVIVCDSVIHPLRSGTTGAALAAVGFKAVENEIGKRDLYGRDLKLTSRAVADNLASTAQLVMGESNEQTPFVLIKQAPITLCDDCSAETTLANLSTTKTTLFPRQQCLFFSSSVDFNQQTQKVLKEHKEKSALTKNK